MNILAEKIEIMKMILDTDNPSILESIKKIFKKNTTADFWDTLPQEQREDILQGIKDIEKGYNYWCEYTCCIQCGLKALVGRLGTQRCCITYDLASAPKPALDTPRNR